MGKNGITENDLNESAETDRGKDLPGSGIDIGADENFNEAGLSVVFKDIELARLFQNNFDEFANVCKPLFAVVETVKGKFPIEILNEIRAFNDHHIRSISTFKDKTEILGQLNKARTHLSRIIMDMYKLLVIHYRDEYDRFCEKYKYADLSLVNDGIFYMELQRKYKDAIGKTTEARKHESNRDVRYTLWEQAYMAYLDLYDYYIDNLLHINRARAKSYRNKILSALGWVLTVILGVVSVVLGITQ